MRDLLRGFWSPDRGCAGVQNRQALDDRRRQLLRMNYYLSNIQRLVTGFPACPEFPMDLETFRQTAVHTPSRHRDKQPMQAANLSDGVALIFTSKEPLVDYAHRLYIPKKGDEVYERKTINPDCQVIPGPDVQLTGLEQFADQPGMLETLSYCVGSLAVEASHAWPNAYRETPKPQG